MVPDAAAAAMTALESATTFLFETIPAMSAKGTNIAPPPVPVAPATTPERKPMIAASLVCF